MGHKKLDWKLVINLYNTGKSEKEIVQITKYKQPSVCHILHNSKAVTLRKKDIRGHKNPNWHGGIMFDGKRKLILSPEHPNPDFLKKYCYEYRLIVEKKLGRYLKSDEIIHHINGDMKDNRIENLKVVTRSEHIKIHHKQMTEAKNEKHKNE
jgi:hypothetical protein